MHPNTLFTARRLEVKWLADWQKTMSYYLKKLAVIKLNICLFLLVKWEDLLLFSVISMCYWVSLIFGLMIGQKDIGRLHLGHVFKSIVMLCMTITLFKCSFSCSWSRSRVCGCWASICTPIPFWFLSRLSHSWNPKSGRREGRKQTMAMLHCHRSEG